MVLEFASEQKELIEVKDVNSKEQKDRIAEFEMVLEDLRFLFNEVSNHYENIPFLLFLFFLCQWLSTIS